MGTVEEVMLLGDVRGVAGAEQVFGAGCGAVAVLSRSRAPARAEVRQPGEGVCVAYTDRMTQTLSFRAEAALAEELDTAAAAAGVARSDLLNRAVRELLYRLRCERDAERYALHPLTAAETTAWPNEAWPDDDTDWAEVFSQ